MLNGIEVLNKVEMYKEFPMILLIPFVVFLILGVCMIYQNGLKNKILAILFLLCCLISLISGLLINSQLSGVVQYQVTISDNVSMVEFNEKYDVISVEGKIYTIVEKEK